MAFDFDAFVTDVQFTNDGAAFALGDGSVRFADGTKIEAHDGAILSACLSPDGAGLVTGGDDGRVVLSTRKGPTELAQVRGRWIDAVAASDVSGLIAFGAGREVHVLDQNDKAFSRVFPHEKSVAGVAFDPKGRRIAVATYGGAALWYARIPDQKPQLLKWAGSHIAVAFSPDGKFLMSSMQENQLHGWRLPDAKDLRMGGYPSKVKSLVFLARGSALATSGSNGAVVWPFSGPNGPMGKQAAEVGYEDGYIVTRVAAAPDRTVIAAGLDDGRVWVMDAARAEKQWVRAEKGAPVSALAMSEDGGEVAWGDEEGAAGVAKVSALR